MNLLLGLVHDDGLTAVVATHDPALVALADGVLQLSDGHLTPIGRPQIAGSRAPVRPRDVGPPPPP